MSLKSLSEVYEAGLGIVGVAWTVVAASTMVGTVATSISLALTRAIKLAMSTRSHGSKVPRECLAIVIATILVGHPAIYIDEDLDTVGDHHIMEVERNDEFEMSILLSNPGLFHEV